MAMKITSSGLVDSFKLEVTATGVIYHTNSLFSAKRVFSFQQIECVLLSESGLLSFQVGGEVFKIQTNPKKARHTEVIDALLAGIRSSAVIVSSSTWR